MTAAFVFGQCGVFFMIRELAYPTKDDDGSLQPRGGIQGSQQNPVLTFCDRRIQRGSH